MKISFKFDIVTIVPNRVYIGDTFVLSKILGLSSHVCFGRMQQWFYQSTFFLWPPLVGHTGNEVDQLFRKIIKIQFKYFVMMHIRYNATVHVLCQISPQVSFIWGNYATILILVVIHDLSSQLLSGTIGYRLVFVHPQIFIKSLQGEYTIFLGDNMYESPF